MTPRIRPVATLAYSAWRNGGGSRVVKPAPATPPPTALPGTTPLATQPHDGPPDPGWRRRSRPPTGTTAPLDGEDFVLHPLVLIIGHVADHRGSAQQEQCGGEEKKEPRRGAGEGAGAAVAWKGEASRCAPPLASLSRCSDSCGGGARVSSEMTDDKQTKIKL